MNFDATIVGKPYNRIQHISISYPAPNTAQVKVTHQQHVLLLDGTHQAIGGWKKMLSV